MERGDGSVFQGIDRILDKNYLPVTSLALLADENPLWKPDSLKSEQWGCKNNFEFPMVKLIDYNDKIDTLLNGTNPFAIITAAHLKTKATKNNPQTRYSWKWTITTALYEKGFSEKTIQEIVPESFLIRGYFFLSFLRFWARHILELSVRF